MQNIGSYFDSPWGSGNYTLGRLVSLLVSNAVAFAGVIMFILILVGGFGFLINAGKNDPQSAAKSKTLLTSAIVGFIIVFASYWIIKIVEKTTGVDILNTNL